MGRIAVISDIHGNMVALERVIADIRARGVDLTICLGDIVGYGPDSKACFDATRDLCKAIVAGNHERGVIDHTFCTTWTGLALAGLETARTQLNAADLEAIAALPRTVTMGDELFGIHDSPIPCDSGTRYLRSRADAALAFEAMQHSIALVGHTHVPACFSTALDAEELPTVRDIDAFPIARRLLGPSQENRGAFVSSATFELPRFGRSIINPGSVGQPRDGDNRSSYAIIDLADYTVEFRRIAYDLALAERRCRARGLPTAAFERLSLGA